MQYMKFYVLNQYFITWKKKNNSEGSGSLVCMYTYAILPCAKMLVDFQWIIPK